MAFEIRLRDPENPLHNWDGLLKRENRSLLFQSRPWVDLLKDYLPEVRERTLVCLEDDRLVGVLPMLVKEGEAGKVANSLPYFGSNASFILEADLPEPDLVRQKLLTAWRDLAEREDIRVSVFIDTPWGGNSGFLKGRTWDSGDLRMGHMTPLGSLAEVEDPVQELMNLLHSKTRNMVRKAFKSNVKVSASSNPEDQDFLERTHAENLAALGGGAKDRRFFDLARQRLDTLTYVAKINDEPVAAAFLVRHGRVIEYFTPALKAEHRSSQPLSGLIFHAMQDLAAQGALWWNWGASWPSQKSLQTFKKRWGTVNSEYGYFISLSGGLDPWLALGPEGIKKEYPYFYVLPFSVLEKGEA